MMTPDLMHALTDLLVAVLTVMIPVVGGFAVNWLKTHTSQKQLDSMQAIGGMAVKAVEQMYDGLSGNERVEADTKLSAAKQRVQDLAARIGIKLNDEQTRTIIEQAVHEMNHDLAALSSNPPVTTAQPDPVPIGG
jgi:LL-H family phage holin